MTLVAATEPCNYLDKLFAQAPCMAPGKMTTGRNAKGHVWNGGWHELLLCHSKKAGFVVLCTKWHALVFVHHLVVLWW